MGVPLADMGFITAGIFPLPLTAAIAATILPITVTWISVLLFNGFKHACHTNTVRGVGGG